MLERMVFAFGPGADEIGSRAFGVITQSYWESAYAGRLRFGASPDLKILATIADSPLELANACSILDKSKSLHDGWRVLAYSSRAPRPYSGWYASARFPIYTVEIPDPLNRFQALEGTASLLSYLGSPSELIEERIRYAVDS